MVCCMERARWVVSGTCSFCGLCILKERQRRHGVGVCLGRICNLFTSDCSNVGHVLCWSFFLNDEWISSVCMLVVVDLVGRLCVAGWWRCAYKYVHLYW